MATTLAELQVVLTAKTEAFSAAMAKARTTLQGIGKTAAQTGKLMTFGLTLPAAAAMGGLVKSASTFEFEMAKMRSVVGLSTEAVSKFREEILRMGPEVAQTPAELARAMFFITSAGLRGAEAMRTLRASALAASAGMGSITPIADAATSAVNKYGREVLNGKEAVAVLLKTVEQGKAVPEELAQSIGMVIPVAAEMGVSFDQVGAAMAAMTRGGQSASRSATGLRALLVSLLNPSQAAEEALNKYGLTSEGLRRTIKERGLLAALMTMRQAMHGNTKALTEAVPNLRALVPLLSLTGASAKETAEIFSTLAGVTEQDLDAAVGKVSDQLQFRFAQSMAKVQAAGIKLGGVLGGPVADTLSKLAEVAERAGRAMDMLGPQGKRTAVNIAALTLAAGPVLYVFGKLTSAAGVLAGALGGLVGAGGAVTGLAVGLTALVSIKVGDWAREFIDDVTGLGPAIATAKSATDEFVASAVKDQNVYLRHLELYNRLRESLGKTGEAYRITADATEENARRLAELIPKLIQERRERDAHTNAVAREIAKVHQVGAAAKDSGDKQVDAANRAFEATKKLYGLLSKEDVQKNLEDLAKKFGEAKAGGIGLQQISDKMANSLKEQLELAKEYGLTLPDSVKKMASEIGQHGYPEVAKLGEELGNLGGYVQISGNVIVNAVKDAAGNVKDSLSGGFGKGVEDGVRYADQVIRDYREKLKREGILVPLIPDDSALKDWLRRHGGTAAAGGGDRGTSTAGATP